MNARAVLCHSTAVPRGGAGVVHGEGDMLHPMNARGMAAQGTIMICSESSMKVILLKNED